MTLAVAALYPWQELLDKLPQNIQRAMEVVPQIRRQERAILFAADSRWSYKIGRDFDDGGVKVAALSSNAAAVYAGNTAAGQKALGRLTAELKRVNRSGYVNLERLARETFQAVWRAHMHQGSGLQVCIGVSDPTGDCRLLRFNNDDGFRPHLVQDVQALGWDEATRYFSERLSDEISREMSTPLTEQALALSAEHWGMVIARLVWETCDERVVETKKTVGGPILSAIITPEGVQGRSLYSVDFRADPPTVNRLSLTPSQVTAFYERQKRRSPHRSPQSAGLGSKT